MSKIQWTDQTWNPIVGCLKVSEGCKNCYAEPQACRNVLCMRANQKIPPSDVLTAYEIATNAAAGTEEQPTAWSGLPGWCGSDKLYEPIHRKKATLYFVCSMGDLFLNAVPESWIDLVFAAMVMSPQHTFQLLTKRAERMHEYLSAPDLEIRINEAIGDILNENSWPEWRSPELVLPLPNVWIGVTTENQEQADKRIPYLLRTPAAVRFVSVEPMLGPVDVQLACGYPKHPTAGQSGADGITWVICGCESGPGRRPMNHGWAQELWAQCHQAGVPFFMKQMEMNGKVCKDIGAFRRQLRVQEYPAVGKGGES